MGALMEKIQNIFSAVAFAEAGEHETALQLSGRRTSPRPERVPLHRWLAAITFAEADCADMARRFMNVVDAPARSVRYRPATLGEFAAAVGLQGARLHYALVNA